MDKFDHNLVKPDFLAEIHEPVGKEVNKIKGKVIEINEGRTLVKVLVQGGRHKWVPITQIVGPALAWNEKAPATVPAPTPKPKETLEEIKNNVENLGKEGEVTPFEKAIAETIATTNPEPTPAPEPVPAEVTKEVAQELLGLPVLQPKVDETVTTPLAVQLNELEKDADKLSRKLLKEQKGKGKSSKERVLELMEQGKSNSDIVSAMPEVTTGYVNQLRNDYFSPPPLKEGTLKFNIVKLHKDGKTVEEISAELKTSVAHVKQQIKINEKRK